MSEGGLTESGGVRSADGPLYADEGQEEADDVDGQRQGRGHQEDVDVLHPAAQRRAVPHLRSASVKTEQLKSCSNRPTTNNSHVPWPVTLKQRTALNNGFNDQSSSLVEPSK